MERVSERSLGAAARISPFCSTAAGEESIWGSKVACPRCQMVGGRVNLLFVNHVDDDDSVRIETPTARNSGGGVRPTSAQPSLTRPLRCSPRALARSRAEAFARRTAQHHHGLLLDCTIITHRCPEGIVWGLGRASIDRLIEAAKAWIDCESRRLAFWGDIASNHRAHTPIITLKTHACVRLLMRAPPIK